MKKKSIGTLHKKGTMFLRQHVGAADGGENSKYEMSLVNMTTPAIESKQTGRHFLLSWEDIINLAVEAGIDKK